MTLYLSSWKRGCRYVSVCEMRLGMRYHLRKIQMKKEYLLYHYVKDLEHRWQMVEK
jgi:hypothetical protein